MLKALERSAAAAADRIVFLAPSEAAATEAGCEGRMRVDAARHRQLLDGVQQLRGSIYLRDGAIQPHQLTPDGRHRTSEDETSWHMLQLDEHDRVSACALYLEHSEEVTIDDLRVRDCPLAQSPEWRPRFLRAVGSEIARARREGLRFVEVGGWAVSEKSRCTAGSLSLALAMYSFGRRGAGSLAMTTATVRHCSANILKRLGGSRFEVDGEALPAYYDPRYGCLMELLRFDGRKPNPRYASVIEKIGDTLDRVTVIARPAAPATRVACESLLTAAL